jgi:hypothetical protein
MEAKSSCTVGLRTDGALPTIYLVNVYWQPKVGVMRSTTLDIRNPRANMDARAKELVARSGPARPSTAMMIGIGVSSLSALGLLLMAATTTYVQPISATNAIPRIKDSSARIVIHAPHGESCQQRRFDNETGRMTELNVSCESRTFDDSGRPVIKGTTGRLNEIGKSFHNR